MKSIFKQLYQWFIAVIIGFLFTNSICFIYERPVGWHDTDNGASKAVRNPNSLMIHGTEGYSVCRIDQNGYTNPSGILIDDYILMMGSSHTQGKEVNPNKKYSVLVNDYLTVDNKLYTYNIACDGHYLPTLIKHFKAAIDAYPNSSMITIEIGGTDFPVEVLRDALNQSLYDEEDTVLYFDTLDFKEKLKIHIKEKFPLISRIKNQMETLLQNDSYCEAEINLKEYSEIIDKAMALIRSEYDNKIVIIYHPEVSIERDGTLSLAYSDTWEIFRTVCESNSIDIIDVGNVFLENYKANYAIPYGFSNTSLASGHLNEVGHKVIADEIIEYIGGIN